jgi:VWFA-related protein
MKSFPSRRRLISGGALILIATLSGLVLAQQQQPDQAEVIRISTELVQTGVVVLDKQGRFVEGLKPEQFVLKVDGQPITPSFVEQVTAGTRREEKLQSAPITTATAPPTADATSYRGRTIVFFLDDLHLSAESVNRTRKLILDFIENQMGPEDRVAIASASGQIGFLQQFTDVKPVLRAAIGRVTHRPYTVRDAENITMTEYAAIKIEQGDKDASDYYTEELLKATNFRIPGGVGLGPPSGGPANARPQNQGLQGGMTRESAANIVKQRALSLLRQASAVTTNTLSTLESLMRSSNQMGGRKLVFFISDGFYLNDRNTAFGDKLKQITDAAVRAGVVIYSIDARGLVSTTDATIKGVDGQGRLGRANIGELSASQDALSALAGDTGGRAVLNTGNLSNAIGDALRETSNYYLLAWRPSADAQKSANFKRIEISVVDRPDLTVRLPRGFFTVDPRTQTKVTETKTDSKTATAPTKSLEASLIAALSAPSAREGLPTQLSVGFLDVPNTGPVLTASMQMATDVLGYGSDGKQPAAIDIAGVVLNDQGKQAGSFKTRVNVTPSPETSSSSYGGIIYTNKLPIKPGLYQVRVAARDDKSGRVGSAAHWIEIPDLQTKGLTLSSLMLGGQFIGSRQNHSAAGAAEQVQFSVDRRFARGSHMNFLTLVYNAARGANNSPDLDAQIKLIRNGQAVVTSPIRKVAIEPNGDSSRIVYGADIALQTLPAGRYLLAVTVNDRIAKTSATQQVLFDIE